MAQRIPIAVDTPACTGCRVCTEVCSVFHEGAVNLEKARIQVDDRYEESLFLPHICQLCENPDCVAACPTAALSQEQPTGLIKVDDSLCNACWACVEACPHDAIYWNEELNRILVCNRCDGDPTCVKFCTSGAIKLA